jgi:hypothetical protein
MSSASEKLQLLKMKESLSVKKDERKTIDAQLSQNSTRKSNSVYINKALASS